MKKYLIAVGIVILFLVVGLSGCVDDYVHGTGTIQYNDFEGGFFGIVGDDGENYDPINLPTDFGEEGLRVKYIERELLTPNTETFLNVNSPADLEKL